MEFEYCFQDGGYLNYIGKPTDPPVYVEFKNLDTDKVVFSTTISPNCWASTNASYYYVRWQINAYVNDEIVFTKTFDLKGKRVVIEYPYDTLGDFLFWIVIFEKFRKLHDCILIVQVQRKDFIENVSKSFPNIIFTVDRKHLMNKGIYTFYYPNLYDYDRIFCNNVYPNYKTTQQASSEWLGMKYEYTQPLIDSDNIVPDIKMPYVCITEHGFSNEDKQWQYPNGWQIVSDFLGQKGYYVAPISKEPTRIKGDYVIDCTGKSIKEMIRYIKNSVLLIGSATGPVVVTAALKKPVISIVTNSWPNDLGKVPIEYVYNHNPAYCFGCYTKGPLEKCKRNEFNVPECSMSITPDMVINKIKEVLHI